MRSYLLGLMCLAVLSVLGLTLVQPSREVRIETEVSHMSPEVGLARLERARAEIAFPENLDLLHARLLAGAGRLDEARGLYASVIERRGATPVLHDELARIETLRGDLKAAGDHLRAAHSAGPSAKRRGILGLHLRATRRTAEEATLLSSVPVAALTAFERSRLAQLLAAAGDLPAYEAVLRAAAALDDASAGRFRAALLSYLMETARGGDAVAVALDWIGAARAPDAVLGEALRTLLGRGARDEAAALAFSAVMRTPGLGAVSPSVFAESGHGGLARALLGAWLHADRALGAEDWGALAAFAARTGDLGELRAALIAHPEVEPPAEVFMVLLRYRGPAAVVPFAGRISTAALAERPLLAAALATARGRHVGAHAALRDAAGTGLSDWDLAIWAGLAGSLSGTGFLAALAADPAPGPAERATLIAPLRGSPVPVADIRGTGRTGG